MESSTSSLMYKGSISDAIVEAQKQKKLIMVYISGDDENSNSLERSTWVDPIVVEAISKYCIFLHLVQGSVGASQFSDIYPQKSVPTITAVGYNGVLLLQHEGYITEENLVRSIEKAWAALQLQETAATLLSAAIVSKNPEPTSSGSCNVVPVAKVDSSSSDVPSTSAEIPPESPERVLLAVPKLIEGQNVCESNADQKDIMPSEDSETHLQTASDADMIICEVEQLNSVTNSIKEGTDLVSRTTDQSGTANDGHSPTRPQENTAMVESHMMISESTKGTTSPEPSQITGKEVEESCQIKVSNSIKTNDVYLNIRLPNGASLQAKFTIIDTLRTVKKYIDENQIGGIGSYDLAIPYPRKVFSDQDMNNPLSELGFSNRQALLVILRHQATGHPRAQIPPNNGNLAVNEADSSGSSSGGGYFDYLRKVISYMNPFSYIGGNGRSSNSETTSSDSLWQYRPNPALQNQLSEAEAYRRSQHNLDNRNPSSRDNSSGTRTTSRPFGSNIHTLRRDEDESQSRDKNTFWNGNSTEYGGDDK